MKKYTKVTDIEVLQKYYEVGSIYYDVGIWADYISIDYMASLLNTSKYQVQKAYKSLKEQGYMKISKVPSYCEEYDDGLIVPILYTKIYIISDKGLKYIKSLKENTDVK